MKPTIEQVLKKVGVADVADVDREAIHRLNDDELRVLRAACVIRLGELRHRESEAGFVLGVIDERPDA